MNSFSLARLPLLAGELGLCPLPGGAGPIAEDVAHIRQWGARAVLTLVEAEELDRLGAADLPEMVRDAGMGWLHFPIVDYGVPAGAGWSENSQNLLSVLASGGKVAIHCRGGCGRTGMIALRLMLDAGEAPDTALARLRAARPCAIETEAQMVWATTVGN